MKRFLQIARGSASELEYHLMLARDLHMLEPQIFESLDGKILEIQRMLAALVQRLQQPVLARS
jgi:four helix bundle protein